MSTDLALPDLADAVNRHHALAARHAATAVEHARQCGELLTRAKAEIPHGGWLDWLGENCDVSSRQAQRYMRVARDWDHINKNDTASFMTITEAIAASKQDDLSDEIFFVVSQTALEDLAKEADPILAKIDGADSAEALEELLADLTPIARESSAIVLKMKARFGAMFSEKSALQGATNR